MHMDSKVGNEKKERTKGLAKIRHHIVLLRDLTFEPRTPWPPPGTNSKSPSVRGPE